MFSPRWHNGLSGGCPKSSFYITRDYLCSIDCSVIVFFRFCCERCFFLCLWLMRTFIIIPIKEQTWHLHFLVAFCFYKVKAPNCYWVLSKKVAWTDCKSKHYGYIVQKKVNLTLSLSETVTQCYLNSTMLHLLSHTHWSVSWIVLLRKRAHWPYCLLTLSAVTPSMCSVGGGRGSSIHTAAHAALLESLFGKFEILWCGDSSVTSDVCGNYHIS